MSNQNMQYALGIDLGGTKIELGIVDEKGHIHGHQRLDTLVQEGPTVIEKQILKSIDALQQTSNIPLSGVGIGVAGQIQPQTGVVIFAPNLKWHNFPLQTNIEKALRIPTRIINDVRAITLGEWLYGAGKGCLDLLCVFIGTGIGSGVVSGGRLLTGCSNTFGEVGHLTIDFNGPFCSCGKRGCLEAFAGGWGIAARAWEIIEADQQADTSQKILELSGNLKAVTAKIIVEAYRQKNPIAEIVIEQAKQALIAGLASLVNVYNPCRLILGGGLIDGMPEMVQIMNEEINKLALKAATQSLEIVKAQLGKEVGIIGSAAAIFNLLREKQETI